MKSDTDLGGGSKLDFDGYYHFRRDGGGGHCYGMISTGVI